MNKVPFRDQGSVHILPGEGTDLLASNMTCIEDSSHKKRIVVTANFLHISHEIGCIVGDS